MEKCSKLFKTKNYGIKKMALYLEINDGYGEYERKHGTFPDVLFVNHSTASYLREHNLDFNVFMKPVFEVFMDVAYLWVDNKTLEKAKNSQISEGEKGIEVFVSGLVIRRHAGQILKTRTFEPVFIPLGVLHFEYP